MITHAGFNDHLERKFWCEAVSTATKLNNIMVTHMGGTTCFSRSIQNTENISEFWKNSCGSPS